MTIEDIIKRINELLEFNHWTLYKLAKESDLPFSSLNNIYNRKTFPSILTLCKICKGFNITLSEFFDYDKFPLRDYSYSEDEQALINKFRSLPNRKKELLKAYLDGLLAVKKYNDVTTKD